jgi:hypothetical protein
MSRLGNLNASVCGRDRSRYRVAANVTAAPSAILTSAGPIMARGGSVGMASAPTARAAVGKAAAANAARTMAASVR